MEQINPLDTRLIDQIKDLGKRVYNLETTKQLPAGEWNEENLELFTFVDANEIDVSLSINPEEHFQIGDKLRIIQGGNTKYFYVYRIDRGPGSINSINITAGDDFTFTNDAITEISTAQVPFPHDFPDSFSHVTTCYHGDLTTIQALDVLGKTMHFWMIGNNFNVSTHLKTSTLSAGEQVLYFTLPFGKTPSEGVSADEFTVMENPSNTQTFVSTGSGQVTLGGSAQEAIFVALEQGGTYSSGFWDARVYHTFLLT